MFQYQHVRICVEFYAVTTQRYMVAVPHLSHPDLWGLATPQVPPNQLPEVFSNPYAYNYSGNALVGPALGARSALPVDVTDPDTIVIQAPDKIEFFNTPRGVEYIEIPPNGANAPTDPTGNSAMLDFMGFTQQATQPSVPGQQSMPNFPINQPGMLSQGIQASGTQSGALAYGSPSIATAPINRL